MYIIGQKMKQIELLIEKYLLNEGGVDYIAIFEGNLTDNQLKDKWEKNQKEEEKKYGKNPYNGTSATMDKRT